jgi:DNA modification methylase
MFRTQHTVEWTGRPASGADASPVHLVVTSPPYPMVEMWDASFSAQSSVVEDALADERGTDAFEAMHALLDPIWATCFERLVPGGIICVNVGDATRTLGGQFRLYSNHARTIQGLLAAGFQLLPDILWRKPTNAPNKFMGSGMLPAGAYVTYEHEYVIIGRKGDKRAFRTQADRQRRRRSAFFWEERNVWFSDLWQGLTGTRQRLDAQTRKRSGAFPVELPARLIDMYSLQEDRVLDPFAGTGTTALAAAAAGRHSVSVEREPGLSEVFAESMDRVVAVSSERAEARLAAHRAFVSSRLAAGKVCKHHNGPYGFPVVTGQERDLALPVVRSLSAVGEAAWEAEVGVGTVPLGAQAALL